jgi:hypothetical protein
MRLKVFGPLALAIFALLAGATPSTGQWRAEPLLRVMQSSSIAIELASDQVALSPTARPPGHLKLAVVGVTGAAIGSVGGALLGYHFDVKEARWGCERGCEDPGLVGAVGGWFVGSALATPLAVHLANSRRGSLATAYLSSAVVAGAGMVGMMAAGSPGAAFVLLGVPAAQVISAVLIERRVTR